MSVKKYMPSLPQAVQVLILMIVFAALGLVGKIRSKLPF